MLKYISQLLIVRFYPLFLTGISITLKISFAGFFIAALFSLPLVFARRSKNFLIRFFGNILVQISRNTPILVSLVWIYYALPVIIGIKYGAITASIIAIALQASGYQSEVYRAGIDSIDRGQIRAAKALGMSPFLLMSRIVLPQVIRRIIPPTINVFSTSLKSTAIVSFIAVPDIMHQCQTLNAYYFRPLEIYTSVALLYIFLVGFTSYIADWLNFKIKEGEIIED